MIPQKVNYTPKSQPAVLSTSWHERHGPCRNTAFSRSCSPRPASARTLNTPTGIIQDDGEVFGLKQVTEEESSSSQVDCQAAPLSRARQILNSLSTEERAALIQLLLNDA